MKRNMDLAKRILDVIPPSMGKIRGEMRKASPSDLSVPQFRILANIFRKRNLIGELAKHLGVSQPATSKMVDGLVEKGLIERDLRSTDRRRIPLKLTKSGMKLFLKVRKSVQAKLTLKIANLSPGERSELENGLKQIEKVFLLEQYFETPSPTERSPHE